MKYATRVALIISVIFLGAISYMILLDRDSLQRSQVLGLDTVGNGTRSAYYTYVEARKAELHSALKFLAADERLIYAVRDLRRDWLNHNREASQVKSLGGRDFLVSFLEQLWSVRGPLQKSEPLRLFLRDSNHRTTLLYSTRNSNITGGTPSELELQLIESADGPQYSSGFIASSELAGIHIAVPLIFENKETAERQLIGTLVSALSIESLVETFSNLSRLEVAVIYANSYVESHQTLLSGPIAGSTSSKFRKVGDFLITFSSNSTVDEFLERSDFGQLYEGQRSKLLMLGDLTYLTSTQPIRDLKQETQQDATSAGAVLFWQEADKQITAINYDLRRNAHTAVAISGVATLLIFVVLWIAFSKTERDSDESSTDLRRLAKELHDEVKVRQSAQERLAEEMVKSELMVKSKCDFLNSFNTSISPVIGELSRIGRSLSGYRSETISVAGLKIADIGNFLERTLLGTHRILSIETFGDKEKRQFSLIELTEGWSQLLAPSLKAANLELDISFALPFPITFYGNASKIELLVYRLLQRAIAVSKQPKSSINGNQRIKLAYEWVALDSELTIQIEDCDDAKSVDKHSRDFSRLQSSRNALIKALDGIELELPIVIELSRQLGAIVSYRKGTSTSPEAGSTITVHIPELRSSKELANSENELYCLRHSGNPGFASLNGQIMLVGLAPEVEGIIVHWGSRLGVEFLSSASLSDLRDRNLKDVNLIIMDEYTINSSNSEMEINLVSPLRGKIVLLVSSEGSNNLDIYRSQGYLTCLLKPLENEQLINFLREYISPCESAPPSLLEKMATNSSEISDAPIESTLKTRSPVEQAILISFGDSLARKLGSLEEAMESQDFKSISRESQLLAESAAQLGYPLLQEHAKTLEVAASRNDPQSCRKSISDLSAIISRISRVSSLA